MTTSPFREEVELARSTEALPYASEEGLDEAEAWYVPGSDPTPFVIEPEAEGWEEAEDEATHPILTMFPLPNAVVDALSGGLSSLAVGLAVGAGYRDVDQLTNIVFYFRHPDVIGRKIRPDERELAAEWVAIRDRVVKPALRSASSGVPAATTTAPPVVTGPPAVAGAALSSSMLVWPEAKSAEELAFMKAVYDRHAERGKASGGSYVFDLPKSALDPIEGREARKDAVAAMRALLGEARAALVAEGLADKIRIGITSAYRSATRQFEIWQGRTFDGKPSGGGFPFYYREAIKNGIVSPGDFSPAAVEKVAKYLGGYIASPGYSNHQDGLAFDLGTGEVGKKGLGKIGWRSWFRGWLEKNAKRFGFYPLSTEAWHWTFHPPAGHSEVWSSEVSSPAGVRANRIEVARVPLLARHRGGPPDLILRWNDMPSVPDEIDVVVHLHGFWYSGMKLPRDIERVSGLDLTPIEGAEGQGRSRPTLTVLPRAHNTGVKQTSGPYTVYTFPALVTKDGLTKLVQFSLDRFAAEVGGVAPRVGRLILTAHSGGGKALLQILQYHDPHQVHVFDALYWPPGPLADWAKRRIAKDRAAVQGLDATAAREYMSSRGGALRVFYMDRTKGGTRPNSLALRDAISAVLGDGLETWYRVEASKYDHFQIPRRYGWRVLADAAADVPDAYREEVAHHREADLEESEFDELSEVLSEDVPGQFADEADLWEEDESAYDEADEAFDVVATSNGRGPLAAQELAEAELDAGEALWEIEEAEYEDPPPPAPGGGSTPSGKWIVLVAGFDYEQKGVDFEQIALNRMRLLIRRNVAAQKKAKTPLDVVIDTAPRFVLFDFKSGLVRRSVATKPSGTRTWTEIAKFNPVTTANYSVRASGRHVFDTDQAGTMSVTDVYDHVREIGRTEPGSLAELSFLSHGWIGGPILVNSDDMLGSGTNQRDPNDRDTRLDKDFIAPTMDAAALAEFRAAFATDGFVWTWGCVFAASPRQTLHRLLSSRKYKETKLGGLVDSDTFKLTFEREQANQFFDIDPAFFPTRGADGEFPLTFERSFDQVKDYFRGRLSQTYCQTAAVAAQVPCFGGLPGTYSDYERGADLPVMVVPTRKPPYSDDFTRSIRFYTTYLGVALDPEGRNYGRYDP